LSEQLPEPPKKEAEELILLDEVEQSDLAFFFVDFEIT
jgi:hypothetical protein